MAVVIRFPNGTEWFYANRFYRQLLVDLRYVEPEMAGKLRVGLDIGALFIDQMEQRVAREVVSLLASQCEIIATRPIGAELSVDEREFRIRYQSLMLELAQLARTQARSWT